MKLRPLLLVAAGLAAGEAGRRIAERSGLVCLLRRKHDPARHPMGAFRCRLCRRAGADLGDFGSGSGPGYVLPTRRTYRRINGGETSRTDGWEAGPRGW